MDEEISPPFVSVSPLDARALRGKDAKAKGHGERPLVIHGSQVEESSNRPWRTEPTYVAKYGDDLWLGVKGQPRSDIAGFPRNLF